MNFLPLGNLLQVPPFSAPLPQDKQDARRPIGVRGRLRSRRVGHLIGVFGCSVVFPLTAFAELSNDSLLGPGLRLRPAYDGSGSRRAELVPVIRYLGQPLFARSTQGVLEAGVRMELADGLHAGAQVAYEPGRLRNDAEFLKSHNVADIKRGESIGLQLEWDHMIGPAPITLLARIRKNTESDLGTQADLRLSIGIFQRGGLSAGLFAEAISADAKSTRAFYGIDPQQSGVTGLPAFQPAGGWLNASLGLLWSYDLNPNWIVVGSLESRRLLGDSVHSPLTQRSSAQYVSVGLAYRF